MIDIFCDPQTSGGLLISVSREDGEQIMKDFAQADMETTCRIIGEVTKKQEKSVKLRNHL